MPSIANPPTPLEWPSIRIRRSTARRLCVKHFIAEPSKHPIDVESTDPQVLRKEFDTYVEKTLEFMERRAASLSRSGHGILLVIQDTPFEEDQRDWMGIMISRPGSSGHCTFWLQAQKAEDLNEFKHLALYTTKEPNK